MLRFTAVLWTKDGVERPWQTIPAADRSAVCDLIIAASVDHEEQFSKLTDLLKGLLWPNFWAEIESHQWANLEAMIESM